MFGRSLKLFTILGFEVRINLSWAFLAILIAFSLARGFFPALYEGWPETTYWWMAIVGVIGVFFSIVIHELSHSLAARAFGMRMRGITLFLFGGVAEMEQEPVSAKAEFVMALAGPAISVIMGALFIWLAGIVQGEGDPTPLSAIIEYLGWLNYILAVFNLMPAFPLDGGRVLRAALWAIANDIRWATKWASRMGAAFGFALILLGILSVLTGAFVQGLWWFLIGMFIRAAAQGSYLQMEARRMMGGLTVGDLMETQVHAVSPGTSIKDLVEHYVYGFHQTVFPVCENETILGVVGVRQIRSVPHDQWHRVTVGEVMIPTDQASLLDPSADVLDALLQLHTSGTDTLVVAEGKRLLGTLSSADVVKLLNLKMDLEAAS